MGSFMYDLLSLDWFLFENYDSILVIIPLGVLFFCFTFALIRRLVRKA